MHLAPASVVVREKTEADHAGCLALLMEVHEADGYPLQLARGEVARFFASGNETAAWVAEHEGRILAHVALHGREHDPTLAAAARATGLPVEQLVMVARLFVVPAARRTGLGRTLVRHAAAHARSVGQRAVLDVGQTLLAAVALYESEGWERVGELHLPFDEERMLDLWVYVSPVQSGR